MADADICYQLREDALEALRDLPRVLDKHSWDAFHVDKLAEVAYSEWADAHVDVIAPRRVTLISDAVRRSCTSPRQTPSQFPEDELEDGLQYTLANLLRDMKVIEGGEGIGSVPYISETSPSFRDHMTSLQQAQDQKEYDRMTHTPIRKGLFYSTERVSFKSRKEDQEWKQAKKEIGAVINVLASMMAVATAAWWASGNASPLTKLCFAMGSSIFIGAAETFLYIRFFSRNDPSRPKRKRSRKPLSLKKMLKSEPPITVEQQRRMTSPLSGEPKERPQLSRTPSARKMRSDAMRKRAITRCMQRSGSEWSGSE